MSQPVSGCDWSRVSGTAAGTTTLTTGNKTLARVVIGATKEGTVTFYDSSSGTTASLLSAIGNTGGSIPTSVEIGARVKAGITCVQAGTTDMLVMYE